MCFCTVHFVRVTSSGLIVLTVVPSLLVYCQCLSLVSIWALAVIVNPDARSSVHRMFSLLTNCVPLCFHVLLHVQKVMSRNGHSQVIRLQYTTMKEQRANEKGSAIFLSLEHKQCFHNFFIKWLMFVSPPGHRDQWTPPMTTHSPTPCRRQGILTPPKSEYKSSNNGCPGFYNRSFQFAMLPEGPRVL